MSARQALQDLRSLIERDLQRARIRRQDAATEHSKAESAVSAFIEAMAHCDAAIVAAEKEEAKRGAAK